MGREKCRICTLHNTDDCAIRIEQGWIEFISNTPGGGLGNSSSTYSNVDHTPPPLHQQQNHNNLFWQNCAISCKSNK